MPQRTEVGASAILAVWSPGGECPNAPHKGARKRSGRKAVLSSEGRRVTQRALKV